MAGSSKGHCTLCTSLLQQAVPAGPIVYAIVHVIKSCVFIHLSGAALGNCPKHDPRLCCVAEEGLWLGCKYACFVKVELRGELL